MDINHGWTQMNPDGEEAYANFANWCEFAGFVSKLLFRFSDVPGDLGFEPV